MRKSIKLNIDNKDAFLEKLLIYANQFNFVAYLDSNRYSNFGYHSYNKLIAIDEIKVFKRSESNSFDSFSKWLNSENDWVFGHFNYDLKNELENLNSANIDFVQFPQASFFIPKYLFVENNNEIFLHYHPDTLNENQLSCLIDEINETEIRNDYYSITNKGRFRLNKTQYLDITNQIIENIKKGDIYELNFCNEYYIEETEINPVLSYFRLKDISPTPFSCFYKLYDKYLLSASPERFIKKINNNVVSQPIKGTIQRGNNEKEDGQLKDKLSHDPKEIAENTMITDLVRNDLSKFAIKGSVNVEEFCGLYSFSHVHQLITTISATIKPDVQAVEIIKNAFPMGSMTGAPKVKAMELIEKYEKTKRGLYSGAVGYFTPEKDFDFNVVIRSILYNESKKYLNFIVGSAITSNSIPENEYNECLVKAQAMMESLFEE